jgi:acyl-CoA thioester hydrolase
MASSQSLEPKLTARSSFKLWLSMPLRYQDLDPLGHVNNAGLPMFFEQARCDFFQTVLKVPGRAHLDTVLARVTMDYLKEIQYPGYVEIGTVCTRIGTKSLTLAHGVFAGDGGTCVGTGEAVLVIFDLRTRSSVPIPDDVREALTQLMP